ncbi:hypothetical protein NXY11_15665 [Parabacteroides faecis]|uniref:hypothetical protein n=1 Tax=Parabacteroides faecis TaxID=1217282 RepID=UPI002164005D|nr:hypothetical protein [Parabacteroides faecis]MCS2891753.1 hypothetical protein [Parabacteroides faecis]UVQ44633.1 hypothetical protein NXY11_15665 [Parabacteroides faecis]
MGQLVKINFSESFKDKKGSQIFEDDVLFNGEHYFRIYWNERQSQIEAISPTYGYLHNLTQEDLSHFERIGTFMECESLMIVD